MAVIQSEKRMQRSSRNALFCNLLEQEVTTKSLVDTSLNNLSNHEINMKSAVFHLNDPTSEIQQIIRMIIGDSCRTNYSITLTRCGGWSVAAVDVVAEVAVAGNVIEEQPGRASLLNHHVVPAVQIISAVLQAWILTSLTEAA
jgi:hypothetical protein